MNEKKLSFYEVDPRYFKDYSGNGTGDLAGLANKFDYFAYLGIDAIILKNITAVDSVLPEKEASFTKVAPETGDANSLIRVISQAKKHNQKVLIDLPIGFIKENHNWFKSAEHEEIEEYTNVIDFKATKEVANLNYGYTNERKQYFVKDEKTQLIPLNWKSEQVMDHFFEVIRYWKDLGVDGFVFKDFEFLAEAEKQELMSEATLKELRKFYRGIKEIDDSLIIIGRSNSIPLRTITNYTDGATKVFDYFISETISLLGTHKKFGKDLIGKFSSGELARKISLLANDPKNILTFDSENVGRVISRWGNDVQYLQESAKALSILLQLTRSSSSIYYGHEIATPNIGLTHLDDFQDQELVERKRFLMAKKVPEAEILNAQVFQGAINARALMAWDDSKNGGFSINEHTITPASTTYRQVNVKNEYADPNSVLAFNRELLSLIKKPSYQKIIEGGRMSIGALIPGVIKYSLKDANKERELLVLVNLTDKNKRIKKPRVGKVILSSYNKQYSELPKVLEPFEALIISKQTDELFKETQAIKVAELKQEAKAEKEAIRIKELKVKEDIAKAKEAEKAAAEKTRLMEIAKAEKAKAREEAKAEKTRLIELEKAEKARIAEEKAKALAEAKAEKTRLIELEKAEKAKAAEEKAKAEEAAKIAAEKEAEAKAREEAKAKEAESKAKEREEAEAQKAKLREEKLAEKTRLIELKQEAKAQKIAAKEEARAQRQAEKDAARAENQAAKEAAREAKEEAKAQTDEEATDLSSKESRNIIHEISKKDESEFVEPEVINKANVEEAPVDDEIARAKEAAKADREINRSYKDEQTNLKEDELAKTILVGDDFDIDDLFEEENEDKK